MKPLILFKNNSENQWKQDRLKNLNSNINLSNFLVKSNYLEISDIELFTNNYNLNENKKVVIGAKKAQKGTILISTVRPTRGAICELKENIYVSNALLQINTNNYFFNKFLLQLFLQNNFILKLNELCEGGTYPTVKKENILNLEIFYPKNEVELQSIASFFYNFDSLILREQIKLKQLKTIKKAMLEKMFPKENSNLPELRFKGFTETWEQCKLKDFTERIIEKNKNLDTLLPLTISTQYGLISQTEFFNKQIASKNLSNYYLLKKGDFAYNKSYSGEAPWGSIKRLDKYEKGALSTLYIAFKIKNINQIDSEFLNTFYKTNKWYTDIQNIATEGARNHGLLNISSNDFFETFIKIPNIEEQKQIGDFFSKIDSLITLHQYMYNKLFQVKNNIFPRYSAYYSNILHNFLPLIFTYAQPQYKSHTKKIY